MLELTNRAHNRQMDMFNPFREMEQLEHSLFGDAFDHFFDRPDLAEFKTDITDEGDHYLMEADLPGFDKKDIHLDLSGNTLMIQAQRHSKAEQKDAQNKIVRVERSYGSYSRRFDVSSIDCDHIRVSYENGVLALVLPKKQNQTAASRVLEIE